MVKRSIEQDIRNKNFGAINGNYERNAVVNNPGTKQRGQTTLGDCWQWEFNGQCSRGDNCSFRHDINKCAKMTQPNPVVECFDCDARIKLKELAPIHSVNSGTLQNACSTRPRVVADLGKSAHMDVVRLMNNLVKGPKKNDDKSAVAMLKKNDLHESWQLVVNRDKSHERPGRPDIKRDTCHELKRGPVGRRSSNARQLGCVFHDMKPPKSILRKS